MYIVDNDRTLSDKSPVLFSLAKTRFCEIVGEMEDDEVFPYIKQFGYLIGVTKA